MLGEVEAAALVEYWSEQFETVHAPGFTLCMGEGQWLKGREATLAHLRWADVPASLIRQWTRERNAG